MTHKDENGVPAPRPWAGRGALPHPLTIFLTAAQRRAVLRALRTIHPDRAVALQRALRPILRSLPKAGRTRRGGRRRPRDGPGPRGHDEKGET